MLQTDNHTSIPPLWPLIMILPRASTHLNLALGEGINQKTKRNGIDIHPT